MIRVQHQLFNLGAELATPQPAAHGTNLVRDADVAWLEQSIDGWEQDARAAQDIHFARRFAGGGPLALGPDRLPPRGAAGRASLAASESIRGEVIRYVNRLSDALFVAARSGESAGGSARRALEAASDEPIAIVIDDQVS